MNKDIINLISNGIQDTFEEDREKIRSFIKDTIILHFSERCIPAFTDPGYMYLYDYDFYVESEKFMKINDEEVNKLSNNRIRVLTMLIDCIKGQELCYVDDNNEDKMGWSNSKGFFFKVDGQLVIL